MSSLERLQFQYVYPPDRGREFLIPTPESLFNGFRNTAHNRKNFRRVKNACLKAYSNLQSGYYFDAEGLFSEVSSQIPATLGFLLVRGVTQLMISDLHGAKANLERGLGVSIAEGNTRFEAAFRINLGQLYPDLAKGTLGKSVLDNAIELCKSQGHSSLLTVALRQQALVHLFLGAPEKSEILVQSGMAIANSADRRNELTFLYYVLGILRYATGDLHSAEKHLLRSIETGRSVKRAPITRAWSQVGLLRLLLGNPDGARNAVEKTLETAKQGGNILDVARAVGLGFTLEVATGNRTPDAFFFRSGYRNGTTKRISLWNNQAPPDSPQVVPPAPGCPKYIAFVPGGWFAGGRNRP